MSWEGTRGSSWEVSKETAPRPFPVVSRTGMEHISVAFQTLTVWPTECARESLHTAVPPDICLEGSQTDRCVRAAAPDSEPAQGPRDKILHWRPGVPRVGCHLSDKSQVSQEPAPLWHSDQAPRSPPLSTNNDLVARSHVGPSWGLAVFQFNCLPTQ